jgi:hypothetical protein
MPAAVSHHTFMTLEFMGNVPSDGVEDENTAAG